MHTLVRRPSREATEVFWDPGGGRLDASELEGFDAVVHLAGENIASGRWTKERKERIRSSRVQGTSLLAERMAQLERPPAVWLSASAVGFYGDRGAEPLVETSQPGEGFLAEVCKAWEGATAAAPESVRVVHLRTGMVLGEDGGALERMLLPFRLGFGGVLGDGRQYMSWISLGDLVAAMSFLLGEKTLAGPVNMVAPDPLTNREFTETLGRALKRPTVLPAPAFALRLALGQMADELLLSSARVVPRRLLDAGFTFRSPNLAAALGRILAKDSSSNAFS